MEIINGENLMTQERRSDCLAHASLEATLGSMNEKIDLILERQLEYSNRITNIPDHRRITC